MRDTHHLDLEEQLERGRFPEALKGGIRTLVESLEYDSPIIVVSPRKIGKKEPAAYIKAVVGRQSIYVSLSLQRFYFYEPRPSLFEDGVFKAVEYPLKEAAAVFRNAVGLAINIETRRKPKRNSDGKGCDGK